MRIIGEIEHPVLKITVFKMSEKLSIKFESGLYEQTYKLRPMDAVKNMDDIRQLVDEPFIVNVMEGLRTMHQNNQAALGRFLPEESEEEFEEII